MFSEDMSLAIFPSLGTLQTACAAAETFPQQHKADLWRGAGTGYMSCSLSGLLCLRLSGFSLEALALWSLKLLPIAKFSLDADVANNSANEFVIGNFLPRDMWTNPSQTNTLCIASWYLIKWRPRQACNPFHFLDNFRLWLLDFQSMPVNKLQKSEPNLIKAYANAVGIAANPGKDLGPKTRHRVAVFMGQLLPGLRFQMKLDDAGAVAVPTDVVIKLNCSKLA